MITRVTGHLLKKPFRSHRFRFRKREMPPPTPHAGADTAAARLLTLSHSDEFEVAELRERCTAPQMTTSAFVQKLPL